MTLELPRPIAAYFTAEKGDSEAVAECFTENAVVKDEGRTHQGRDAIRQWKEEVSAKFQYTIEPLACEQKSGQFVVSSKVTGNFPGSSVILRFFFKVEGERIGSLEIIP